MTTHNQNLPSFTRTHQGQEDKYASRGPCGCAQSGKTYYAIDGVPEKGIVRMQALTLIGKKTMYNDTCTKDCKNV